MTVSTSLQEIRWVAIRNNVSTMLFKKVAFSVCIWNSAYAKAGDARDVGWSLVWKIPWRRKWQLTPIFLLGKFHGQRSLVGYILEGHKEWNTTECVHVHVCACAHTHTHTHTHTHILEIKQIRITEGKKKKTFKYINEWIKLSTALSNLHGNQTSDGNIWKQKEIFMSNT